MKLRVDLTGGIPLKSLRIFEIREAGLEDGAESRFPDTWLVEDLLHDIYSRNFESDYDLLASALQFLSRSAVAGAMIHDAVRRGWEIGLSALDTDFHIDVPEQKIILNNQGMTASSLARSVQINHEIKISLLRALRDVWQENRHGGFDEKFSPEHVMLLERVRCADGEAVTALCAFEIKAVGYPDLWKHLLASGEGDIAQAFAATLERHQGASYPVHKALGVAFDQWFRSEPRLAQCDHETLEYMDEIIRIYSGSSLGRSKPKAIDIEALSCLPDRTAYLQDMGGEILAGPHYAGLNDPVNQAHFAQVMHDAKAVMVQGVPFRDAALAGKIFPGGRMTEEPVSEPLN